MLKQVQLIAGAGDICRSRFEGRVYEYGGEVRGHNFNRGVDPGSPISVLLFKLFMNTDEALTGLNDDILWAAAYSDDRAALASADQIVSGVFQQAHDSSYAWSLGEECKYHKTYLPNSAKENPKGPQILEYKAKNMPSVVDNHDLHLGDSPFKVVNEMRELGLNVSTDRSVKGAPKIIDKWGYFFRPELTKLASLAYRIQSLKYHYPPQFVRQIVLSYFCGIVRYGSCLYYHRSSQSDLDKLRFYYTMACAAILCISTIDVVKATCCKSMAVKKDNTNYLKLLKMVGLPTFEEMAEKDSVSATRQVFLLKPEFFIDSPVTGGRPRRVVRQLFRFGVEAGKINSDDSEKVKKAGLPSSLSKDVISSGAIIGDICRLAWLHVNREIKPNASTEYEYEYYLRLAKKCHLQE